eukprot:7275819-Pyramimonas_sp.AAC.1
MARHGRARAQTGSVLLAQIMHAEPTLAPSGTLSSTANPWMRQCVRDLSRDRATSGAGAFFEVWAIH